MKSIRFDLDFRPDTYDCDDEEQVIAKISILSACGDTIIVYAKKEDGRIHYSVDDGYDSDFELPSEPTEQPLTMEEMINALDCLYANDECSASPAAFWSQAKFNEESVRSHAEFVIVDSSFYPQLTLWYQVEAQKWLEEKLKEIRRARKSGHTDPQDEAPGSPNNVEAVEDDSEESEDPEGVPFSDAEREGFAGSLPDFGQVLEDLRWERLTARAEENTKDSPDWASVLSAVGYCDASDAAGLCPPVENCSFIRDRALTKDYICHYPIVSWGIANPFGPTWNTLSIALPDDASVAVLFFEQSNPFSQHSVVLGWIKTQTPKSLGVSVIQHLFNTNGQGYFFRSPPTFVASSHTAPMMRRPHEIAEWMYAELIAAEVGDLSEDCRRFEKFWTRPQERVEFYEQRCEAVPCDPETTINRQAFQEEQRKYGLTLTREMFDEWFDLVTDPDHVDAEIEEVCDEWNSAIDRFPRELPSQDRRDATWFHWLLMQLDLKNA